MQGAIWKILKHTNASHLIPKIANPTRSDFAAVDRENLQGYATWIKKETAKQKALRRGISLRGLVLPTDFIRPEDADDFFKFVPWIQGLRSLKIRMQHMTTNNKTRRMGTMWKHFRRTTKLRHLWLAHGLKPVGSGARRRVSA